ncbi:MAG TPA: hypothetical protein DDW42_10290 [Desulfobacteraceae bacterium]|nr:hypothetical protein [Desulfobacteraceae bacterium]
MIWGVAFFFVSCQPKIIVKREHIKEPLVDQFELAESYRQREYLNDALNAYGKYLKEYSNGEKSALALHRMAGIYFKTEKYEKSLGILRRILKEYPNYCKLVAVHYKIARIFYLVGQYMLSRDEAVKWLEKYPGNILKGDILTLLGSNYQALGNDPKAFYWWLKAEQEFKDNIQRQVDLKNKLKALIETSGIHNLELFEEYAKGTEYAPEIYYRVAVIYLEQKDMERARRAVMSLLGSTQKESWVLSGRRLLDIIQEEISVRKGVVGCLLPLSGPFSIYGEEVLNGIQLGMEIYEGAGQNPITEIVIRDTKGNEEQTLKDLEDLVNNENVIMIIGPLSSRTALVAAKRAQSLGVPMITLTQKEGIGEVGDMIFRNFLTPSCEVKSLLNKTIDEMGIKRFGLLYPDNSYGRFFMNLFWDKLEGMGGIVTAIESYNSKDTDFSDQIKKMTGLYYPRPESFDQGMMDMRTPDQEESEIFSDKPEPIIDFDAVFIPDNFQSVAMIAPQLAYHDVLDVLLIGTSLWQSPKLIELTSDYIQDAIFTSGFFSRSGKAGVSAFVENYRMCFESEPGTLAATGYDTIRLVADVMAEDGIRTRKDFQRILLGYRNFEGVTGNISFDSQGDVVKEPLVLTVSGKKMTVSH